MGRWKGMRVTWQKEVAGLGAASSPPSSWLALLSLPSSPLVRRCMRTTGEPGRLSGRQKRRLRQDVGLWWLVYLHSSGEFRVLQAELEMLRVGSGGHTPVSLESTHTQRSMVIKTFGEPAGHL